MEHKILRCLRTNGKTSLTKISELLDIPVSTLHDRIKAYEKSIIKRYTILLDYAALGYLVRVYLLLQANQMQKKKLQEFMVSSEQVNSVSCCAAGYDLAAECIFKDIRELDQFMNNLETEFQLEQKKVLFLTKELKKEGFMNLNVDFSQITQSP